MLAATIHRIAINANPLTTWWAIFVKPVCLGSPDAHIVQIILNVYLVPQGTISTRQPTNAISASPSKDVWLVLITKPT